MLEREDLIKAFGRNVDSLKRQVQGLSQQDSLVQPPARGNCLNWIVGHMADTRNSLVQLVGEKPILTEAQAKRYGYGSAPVCEQGPDLMTLDDLVSAIETSQIRLAAGLQRMSDADLAKEVKSYLGMTSVAVRILSMYYHDTYHLGQTELLRELAIDNKAS